MTRFATLVVSALFLTSSAPLARSAAAPPVQSGGPLQFVEGPTLRAGPDPRTPNVAVIDLAANRPVRVSLFVIDGIEPRWITPSFVYREEHSVPLLGLRADRLQGVFVEIRDIAGAAAVTPTPLVVNTPPLPASFPPLSTTVSGPKMEPGLTLFNATPSAGNGLSRPYIVIVNQNGEVVWYHEPPGGASDVRVLRNGHLLYAYEQTLVREMDFLGNVIAEWAATNLEPAPPGTIPVPIDTFHHDVYELPESYAGDFMALSTEMRVLPDYPTSELDPTQTAPTANVVGDVIVEFRRDGTIMREWKLLDILDPYRMTYDTLSPFWNSTYGLTTVDWSHGNAVLPLPADDSFLVSLRHQDAIVKIDGATGAIDWIFGDEGRWVQPWAAKLLDLRGLGSTWSYHTHSPHITPAGRLILFDNGVYRAIAPDPQLPLPNRFSRAVEYSIDAVAGTARVTWEDSDITPAYYSSIVGDADPLPRTGNVLVVSGAQEIGTQRYAHIFEVERKTDTRVFELFVRDDTGVPPTNWLVYRAQRISGLYPLAEPFDSAAAATAVNHP